MAKGTPLITVIDVGTSKVCTVVGTGSSRSQLRILAHSTVPSRGVRKSNVTDAGALTEAVRSSLNQVEEQLGQTIHSAYLGVSGAHVTFENRRQTVKVGNDRGVVTRDDLDRAPADAARAAERLNRLLLHAIPMEYSIDNYEGIRNPVGMHTREIQVDSHLITGASDYIDTLVQAVQAAGVTVDELVFAPLAAGHAVLTPRERSRGVMVVDIGGGTTEMAGFVNDKVYYTSVIPVGGYQFTNDIAFVYDATFEAAEDFKLKHLAIAPRDLSDDDEVTLSIEGGKELKVRRGDVCKLARERAQELVKLIGLKLQEAETGPVASTRVVLTGAGSGLDGLRQMFEHGLTKHVRMGAPEGIADLPDDLKSHGHSTAVGILLWAMSLQPQAAASTNGRGDHGGNGTGLLSGIVYQIKRLLPKA